MTPYDKIFEHFKKCTFVFRWYFDALRISSYVSQWSAIGVIYDDTKPDFHFSDTEASYSPRENQEVCKQCGNDHVPAFVEMCGVSLPFASSGQKSIQPYLSSNTPIQSSRIQYLDVDKCFYLKECSTASTAPIDSDPMSWFLLWRSEAGQAVKEAQLTKNFSEVSRCSTSWSSSIATSCTLNGDHTVADDENLIHYSESTSKETFFIQHNMEDQDDDVKQKLLYLVQLPRIL
jgi:hypothetical protein